MLVIYKDGVVDLNTILKNTGNIEIYIEHEEELIKAEWKKFFKVILLVSKPTFWMRGEIAILYETSSKEDAEKVRKEMLDAFTSGEKEFIINTVQPSGELFEDKDTQKNIYNKEQYSALQILRNVSVAILFTSSIYVIIKFLQMIIIGLEY